MAMKYLVVDDGGADQDKVVDKRGWNWNAAPPNEYPPDWKDGTMGTVGTTHRVEDPPGGTHKPDHCCWKIVSGAWVQKSQADLDALQLSSDQAARCAAACRLQMDRDALQTLIDDPATPAGMVTDLTSLRDAKDADIDTHQAEWGNLWVRGTNP